MEDEQSQQCSGRAGHHVEPGVCCDCGSSDAVGRCARNRDVARIPERPAGARQGVDESPEADGTPDADFRRQLDSMRTVAEPTAERCQGACRKLARRVARRDWGSGSQEQRNSRGAAEEADPNGFQPRPDSGRSAKSVPGDGVTLVDSEPFQQIDDGPDFHQGLPPLRLLAGMTRRARSPLPVAVLGVTDGEGHPEQAKLLFQVVGVQQRKTLGGRVSRAIEALFEAQSD